MSKGKRERDKRKDENMSLGEIVDNDLQFLKDHLVGKDLGYCISVKNLLAVTFDELCKRKDATIAKRKMFEMRKDTESAEGCTILIQQIYSKLSSIEEKYLYLKDKVEEANKAVQSGSEN